MRTRKKITTVGGLVRSRRKDLGLTQTELARRAGLEQSELSRLEHNEKRWTFPTIIRVSKVLKFRLDDAAKFVRGA